MLEARYEEYNVISKNLPCVFHSNIERTNLKYSKHTNWHENLEIELCTEGEGFILLDGETDDVITGSPNDNEVNIDDIFGAMGTVVEEAYNTENN